MKGKNGVAQKPLRRKLIPVLIIFLGITVVSLALTFVVLEVVSAVRGFVAGEGLWSKTQRDAAFMLYMYGHNRDPAYLERFDAALTVTLGDQTARLELQKSDYDHAVATRGFINGGNHPDDVPGMIRLFRCCSQVSYLRRAVDLWTQGDAHILQFVQLKERLRSEIQTAHPSPEKIAGMLKEIEAINDSVSPLANAFTVSIGEAARWVTRLLFLVTTGIIVVLIMLGSYVSWRILNGIRKSEEQYRALLDTASDALIVVDRDTGAILEVNQKTTQMTGRSPDELIGTWYSNIVRDSGNSGAGVPGNIQTASGAHRLGIIRVDQQVIPVEVSYSETQWAEQPAHLAIIRDITEQVRAERELRISSNAMANMAEGVIITDARRRVVAVNQAFTTITGYKEAEVVGEVPKYPMARRNDSALHFSIWRTVLRTGKWQGEIWNKRKNGETYPELLSISAVLDSHHHTTHYVGVFNDVSAQKDYEQKLHHLAHHDPLTQLPNRAAFEDRCRMGHERALRRNTGMALLFIDLDGFKAVNDTHGHATGDELLKIVGQRLSQCVRTTDAVARVGGDEFTVLLEDIVAPENATAVARKLLAALSLPAQCGKHSVSIFASIGISFYPQDTSDVQTLLTHADMAMYQAKKCGRNNFQFFSAAMAVDAMSRLNLINDLKLAIAHKQFEVHYQPCVNIFSGEIVGLEALIRWHHPKLGMVSPAHFIPLAEEIGYITAISEWVLTEVCRQGIQWQRRGIQPVQIAVNVSPRSFWDADLPKQIGAILRASGWRAENLCLEITEGTMMAQDHPETILDELRAMGCKLAIDDFGIGYSSLGHLKNFAVDYLKIDRLFTSAIPSKSKDLAIVRTIIALGKSLKLRIIAEGIETAEQEECLIAEGCDEGQGYLFSRPLPASAIEPLLRKQFAVAHRQTHQVAKIA